MISITVLPVELWDEEKQEFIYKGKKQTLQMEHSLVSISKWESKWGKPFLGKQDKTLEEIQDYIKFMTITQNVDPEVYECLTKNNIEQIRQYIESPMTATFFSKEEGGGPSRRIITSELIYCWMIMLNIPFECQKWHLNRLLTLIRVCKNENSPSQKRSAKDRAALNAARRKRLNTRG